MSKYIKYIDEIVRLYVLVSRVSVGTLIQTTYTLLRLSRWTGSYQCQ